MTGILPRLTLVFLINRFICVTGQITIHPDIWIHGDSADLTCETSVFATITKDGVEITTCFVNTDCSISPDPSTDYNLYYNVSKNSTSVTINVASVSKDRDNGYWECQTSTGKSNKTTEVTDPSTIPVETTTPAGKSNNPITDDGLDPGAIAGIVIGSVAVIILIGAIVVLKIKKKACFKENPAKPKSQPVPLEPTQPGPGDGKGPNNTGLSESKRGQKVEQSPESPVKKTTNSPVRALPQPSKSSSRPLPQLQSTPRPLPSNKPLPPIKS